MTKQQAFAQYAQLYPSDTSGTGFDQWAQQSGIAIDDQGAASPDTGGTAGSPLGSSLTNLLGGGSLSPAQQALVAGANRAINGGNSDQVQGGSQAGAYNTLNTTGQQGTQNTTGTTSGVQNTTGSTGNIGLQTGGINTTGTTSGTGTSNVIDQYGLGNLLNQAIPNAQLNDQSRSGALQQIATQGNPYLQQQTAQAVNNSLSGPGMQGIGDSARARAAGNAGELVAQNSVANQLAATNQLGGQTASGTLIGQASPLLGTSTTSNQSTLGTQLSNLLSSNAGTSNQNTATSGTSNQNTASNQTGTSNTAGTATGSNLGIATGQIPQQDTQSGGSGCCVIASVTSSPDWYYGLPEADRQILNEVRNALIEGKSTVRQVIKQTKSLVGQIGGYEIEITRLYRDFYMSTQQLRGYYILAEFLVPRMLRSARVMAWVRHNVVDCAVPYCEWKLKLRKFPSLSKVLRALLFLALCSCIGWPFHRFQRSNGEII